MVASHQLSVRLEVISKIMAAFYSPQCRVRAPNVHRDRGHAMEYVRILSDKEFQAQYRLRRVVFNECLSLLDIHLKKNEKKSACQFRELSLPRNDVPNHTSAFRWRIISRHDLVSSICQAYFRFENLSYLGGNN